MTPLLAELAAAIRAGRAGGAGDAISTATPAGAKLLVAADGSGAGTLGDADLDRVVGRDAAGELAAGTTGVRRYGPHGEARQDEVDVFVESFVPPPRLLVFGAVDFTAALVRVAKVLGYHITVCDARPVFATARRFPLADEVVVDWPHRLLGRGGSDAHAPRRRLRPHPRPQVRRARHPRRARHRCRATSAPWAAAAPTPNGSRACARPGSTTPAWLDCRAPIGLDLGARTPEETAVAICAEIIAARTGRADVRSAPGNDGTDPWLSRTSRAVAGAGRRPRVRRRAAARRRPPLGRDRRRAAHPRRVRRRTPVRPTPPSPGPARRRDPRPAACRSRSRTSHRPPARRGGRAGARPAGRAATAATGPAQAAVGRGGHGRRGAAGTWRAARRTGAFAF